MTTQAKSLTRMANTSPPKQKLLPILAILIGTTVFIIIIGPRILHPTNIAWLGEGDPATHYLGWHFFRNSAWSYPIGLNPDYGLELSNSILYSDSNPLLSFIFKPFSSVLPETFQYFGLWLLACFILQAWFSLKLVELITKNHAISIAGAFLFCFSPPMLWRLHGHYNLAGHFLILASLYIAIAPETKNRTLSWALILATSGLTHPYLLAMTGFIWGLDISWRTIKKTLSAQRSALEIFITLLSTSLICWQAGYFDAGKGIVAGGFGFFRMNLLSIIDPSGWSYIIRDLPEGAGDYEGFNYFGLGVIFLAVCTLPAILSGNAKLKSTVKKWPILAFGAICMTSFALSNNIGLGSYNIKIELLEEITPLANTFRASGRMFWPVFYLSLLLIILIIHRSYDKRSATAILMIGLAIQISDTSSVWKEFRHKFMRKPSSTWTTTMVNPFWDNASKKYTKVRWIMPGGHTENWQQIANYAGTHQKSTDAVYLARVNPSSLELAQNKANSVIFSGELEADSLYILEEKYLSPLARNIDRSKDLLANVDGFIVLAPNWKKFTEFSTVKEEINTEELLPARLKLGDRLLFTKNQSGSTYLNNGWSTQEDWGIWSSDAQASIFIPIDTWETNKILIEALPFLSGSHEKQGIDIKINGIITNKVIMTKDSNIFEIDIPKEVRHSLKENDKTIKIEMSFPDAVRPTDIGISSDTRKLAIGLISLSIQ